MYPCHVPKQQNEKLALSKSLYKFPVRSVIVQVSVSRLWVNRNNRTFDCRYNLDALQPICFLRSCIASLLRCMPRAVQITHRIESENVILSSDEVMMNVHWHYCHDTRNSDAGQSSIVQFDINTFGKPLIYLSLSTTHYCGFHTKRHSSYSIIYQVLRYALVSRSSLKFRNFSL